MLPSVQDAYGSLQSFNSSRPAASDYATQANQKFGVDALQGNAQNLQGLVTNLQNSVAAVNPSVTGRTSGTFTTEGQRQALVNREQQPILANLGQQQQAYGQAQSALGTAQTNAGQYANSLYNNDQQHYQQLLDQYSAANSADQFAKQQAASQAQLAEQQREFDLTPRGAAGGGNIIIGGGGGGQVDAPGPSSVGPSMSAKSTGGGFNFTDAHGQPISAATYAQQSGIPLGTLLQQMASQGDTTALNAYAAIANHPNLTAQALANVKKSYSSLYWGT